jgi:hypothetical protein
MAERTTVTQIVQIGVETTPGTSVAATKFLPSLMIETGIDGAFTEQRGSGFKVPVNWIPGKEWAGGTLAASAPTYDELTYLFASILNSVTPTTVATTGRLWTMTISANSEDTVKTFTIEQGSANRAQKFSFGQMTEITMTGNRDKVDVAGSFQGQAFTDGITLSAGTTAVPQIPILPKHVDVWMDDTSVNLGTTKMTRVLNWEWGLKNRFMPLWVVNSANPSYVASMEAPIDAGFKVKMEADAQGMGLLTTARAGAKKFVRLKATSDQTVGAATFYSLQIDMCCQVKTLPKTIADDAGVYAVEWDMGLVYDATWAKFIQVLLTNTLASL